MITRRKICFDNITQGNKPCVNPKIQFESLSDCVSLSCIEGNCIEIEVEDTCSNPCFRVIIDCEDCHKCPAVVKDYCLCLNSDDCPACEICIDGLCQPLCPDDKICDPGTEDCVDCISADDCECNQLCINGECGCPPNQILNDKNCCVDCVDSTHCAACEKCVGGECVVVVCPDGVCDPSTNDCVECLTSGDCSGLNECCINNECQCCPGYVWNPATGTCIEPPECTKDTDCPVCYICVEGDCVPLVCPVGFICVDGKCVRECDCIDRDCPGNQVCKDGQGNCYCEQCVGSCSRNIDCGPGCACIDGNCVKNNCFDVCVTSSDCGPGCGCKQGTCYPCSSFSCETSECSQINGCECNNQGVCQSSNCIGPCTNENDCAPGCGCLNGNCVSCDNLDCDTNCLFAQGCGCPDGENCEDISFVCQDENVNLSWEYVPGNPGTSSGGLPPLGTTQMSVNSQGGNMINIQGLAGAFYLNHRIRITVDHSGPGQWFYSGQPGEEVPVGGSTGPEFDKWLNEAPINHNLYGFFLIYKSTASGDNRTIRFKVYFNPAGGNTLQSPNSWIIQQVGTTGGQGTVTGSTPGYFRLCKNNPHFTFNGVIPTTVSTTGGMQITFTQESPHCLRANIIGCGSWTGVMPMLCKGKLFQIQIDEALVVDRICCDPNDPNCVSGPGSGDPCDDIEQKEIELVKLDLGNGNFVFMINPADLTLEQVFNLSGLSFTPTEGYNPTQAANSSLYQVINIQGAGCLNMSAKLHACLDLVSENCTEDDLQDECGRIIMFVVKNEISGVPHAIVAINSKAGGQVEFQQQLPAGVFIRNIPPHNNSPYNLNYILEVSQGNFTGTVQAWDPDCDPPVITTITITTDPPANTCTDINALNTGDPLPCIMFDCPHNISQNPDQVISNCINSLVEMDYSCCPVNNQNEQYANIIASSLAFGCGTGLTYSLQGIPSGHSVNVKLNDNYLNIGSAVPWSNTGNREFVIQVSNGPNTQATVTKTINIQRCDKCVNGNCIPFEHDEPGNLGNCTSQNCNPCFQVNMDFTESISCLMLGMNNVESVITLNITGGVAPYLVYLENDLLGQTNTSVFESNQISLPLSPFHLNVIDANNCSVMRQVQSGCCVMGCVGIQASSSYHYDQIKFKAPQQYGGYDIIFDIPSQYSDFGSFTTQTLAAFNTWLENKIKARLASDNICPGTTDIPGVGLVNLQEYVGVNSYLNYNGAYVGIDVWSVLGAQGQPGLRREGQNFWINFTFCSEHSGPV